MKSTPLLLVLFAWQSAAFAQELPSDKKASAGTVHLYRNMKLLAKKGFMFGHQDDLAYGVNWKYQDGRSDVKDVTGDYPAVYGWDLSGLERPGGGNNIDGVPFKKMRQFIKDGYARGGVITLSWHADNPLTGKNAWDTTHGTVVSILPGGANHALYKTWLDGIADYLLSLKGKRGELIPVLFRPYHELTGNWFWWCKNNCTPEQFKTLWRFTNYYLREVKQVHNLLYVFNEADFSSKEDFMRYYPGDDMTDLVSFDAYQYNDPQKDDGFIRSTNFKLSVLDSVALETSKITALAETGYEQIPYANWWTETLLKAIGGHPVSFVLLWRNAGLVPSMGKMHYYVPYKGQVSEADFKKFYELDKTLFEKDVMKEKLYE
ncbi:MAG TPA: glycosyl hydrolase [Chitinophagaceae bacterium]|nr:glycosyl hydrolase [Chitinophagaceae bacterium]